MRTLIALTMMTLTLAGDTRMTAQQAPAAQEPLPAFKSSIDLVRISAVVRDKKGRFVQALTARDFEITDGGVSRPITDFRIDDAPLSVAMLFDISGSMEARMVAARETATHLLGRMLSDDEAAIYSFDTSLDEVMPFTAGLQTLPPRLAALQPFGATSLHDAIARTAERVAARQSLRRAVIVFTDGLDNASRLTAPEVSGIASSIDVPVYIVGIVPSIDNPSADTSATTFERSPLTGLLGNLAYWTGGDVFVVSTVPERRQMAKQLIDELRHQYLMAFESSAAPGWHPVVVHMREKDLTVRHRSGYIAGRSQPASH